MKQNRWIDDLIEVYNQLGGVEHYNDVYFLAENYRKSKGASWPENAPAAIRRTVEAYAPSCTSFEGKAAVFYSVEGHGKGVWGLLKPFVKVSINNNKAYEEGIEGIKKEILYLKGSRDAKLVKERKMKDNYTCQICSYRKEINGKFIIDVHHLKPLGLVRDQVVTHINALICLCPNCHRIAHTNRYTPLTLSEIKKVYLEN